MYVEITEYDYCNKLDTATFSMSNSSNEVCCTNSLCSNPPIPICFSKSQFVCSGKEHTTNRPCQRFFVVKRLVVEYICTCCGSLSEVSVTDHKDENIYIECECGERCEPSDSDEIGELRAQGLIR